MNFKKIFNVLNFIFNILKVQFILFVFNFKDFIFYVELIVLQSSFIRIKRKMPKYFF
jgi:hypothetical protein